MVRSTPSMAERKHGVAAPRTTSTITGVDWYAREIGEETHEQVLFLDLDLTEGKTTAAVFTECTFRRVQFNCSSHQSSAFVNCTFQNCSFFETSFVDCKVLGSMFDRCTFDLMRVSGGNWSHVGLPGADLRKAGFENVKLREADLTGARCQGASLRDCDLSGAWLSGAVLSECDLRGSDLSGLEPDTVQLNGAIVGVEQAVAIAIALGLDVRVE